MGLKGLNPSPWTLKRFRASGGGGGGWGGLGPQLLVDVTLNIKTLNPEPFNPKQH